LNSGANDAVLQPDGKIVAVGFNPTEKASGVEFALARYLGTSGVTPTPNRYSDAECNIKSEPDLNTYCYTDVHPIAYSNSHGDCDRDPECHAIRHADAYCNADLNSKTDTDSEE